MIKIVTGVLAALALATAVDAQPYYHHHGWHHRHHWRHWHNHHWRHRHWR